MLGAAAMPDNGAYVAAKHGVHGLTRAAALVLGGTGIRVNAIAPGVTRTGMTSAVSDELLRSVPLRRIAEPEEIAAAVGGATVAARMMFSFGRDGIASRRLAGVSAVTGVPRRALAEEEAEVARLAPAREP